MTEIIIITRDIFDMPSKKWLLNTSIINRIGLLNDMMDNIFDIKKIYFDNIYDDIFACIYKMLILDIPKIDKYLGILNESCSLQFLFNIFTVCDYLNIHVIQIYVSKYIALRLNKMSFTELEDIVTLLLDD